MRYLFRIFLSLLLVAISSRGSLHAQTGPRPSSGSRTITGVILSGKTGHPLEDATVTLMNAITRKQEAETKTDSEGRFSFTSLSDGRFDISAAHRGYIASAYEEHYGVSTAIVTGASLITTGIQFALAPQAVISGTVTEDSGDPVPGAKITLYRVDKLSGTGKMVQASNTIADDTGYFELEHLPADSYFLCASGAPWYAQSSQTQKTSTASLSTLDVAYSTTCYPGTVDTHAAEAITIAAGERASASLTMHAVPAVRLSILLSPENAERMQVMPELRQDIFGISEPANLGFSFATKKDDNAVSFEYSGVAPGQYQVAIAGTGSNASKYTAIDISTGNAVIDATRLLEGGVSGSVRLNGQIQQKITVALEPQQGGNYISTPVKADGSFQMPSIPPGSYNVIAVTENSTLNITQIKATGASVSANQIKIGSEPVTLTLSVATADTVVTGYVASQGKHKSGVFLVLLPVHTSNTTAWRANQSDSDGSYYFDNVFPGEYTLIAIEEGWTLDWAHMDVMSKYLPRGVQVTIPAGAKEVKVAQNVPMQGK